MKPRHFERLTPQAKVRWEVMASDPLTLDDKQVVRILSDMGFPQKRIAALFDCNQGRIDDALKVAA